jgi:hypothetical protein
VSAARSSSARRTRLESVTKMVLSASLSPTLAQTASVVVRSSLTIWLAMAVTSIALGPALVSGQEAPAVNRPGT